MGEQLGCFQDEGKTGWGFPAPSFQKGEIGKCVESNLDFATIKSLVV